MPSGNHNGCGAGLVGGLLDMLQDLTTNLALARAARRTGQRDRVDLSLGVQTSGLNQPRESAEIVIGDNEVWRDQSSALLQGAASMQEQRCEEVVRLLSEVHGAWVMLTHALVGCIDTQHDGAHNGGNTLATKMKPQQVRGWAVDVK